MQKRYVSLSSGSSFGYYWITFPKFHLVMRIDHFSSAKNLYCCVCFIVKVILQWWYFVDKLMMSPFRTMVVPPPMCAYSLNYKACVKCVAFCDTTNQMAVLLNNGELVIYSQSAGECLPSFRAQMRSAKTTRSPLKKI